MRRVCGGFAATGWMRVLRTCSYLRRGRPCLRRPREQGVLHSETMLKDAPNAGGFIFFLAIAQSIVMSGGCPSWTIWQVKLPGSLQILQVCTYKVRFIKHQVLGYDNKLPATVPYAIALL